MKSLRVISAAVEGDIDEAVLQRLVVHVGGTVASVYGRKGKAHLRAKILGYNNTAKFSKWCVLADLDTDFKCAPNLVEEWLAVPAQFMCFRVAVHAIESWLLADAETIAAFLGVARSKLSFTDSDAFVDPKRAMVDFAGYSRRREIREDIVPRLGSGRRVGPAYTSRMIEYSKTVWRPDKAVSRSESLRRCIESLRRLTS